MLACMLTDISTGTCYNGVGGMTEISTDTEKRVCLHTRLQIYLQSAIGKRNRHDKRTNTPTQEWRGREHTCCKGRGEMERERMLACMLTDISTGTQWRGGGMTETSTER